MPLYEWRCQPCGSVFEVLASLSRASRAERCPRCGGRARRLMSAGVFGIGRARPDSGLEATPGERRGCGSNDFTIPPMARFCGMDDKTAERFAAYKAGRGREFDDRQAALQEHRKREGIEPSVKSKKKTGLHGEH